MSQTVTQKQCIESKTGLAAQVHTQRTMAARMVRPGLRALRPSRPCRGVQGTVSQACGRPCCRPGCAPCRHAPTRIAAHCVTAPVPCRGLLLCSIAAQCHRIVTQGRPPPPPPSATIQTFVSRPCSQPSTLRAV